MQLTLPLANVTNDRCEWETYMDWIADDGPMLHQILVEVHSAPIDKALDFYDSIERAGYLRFHKEPNIQWGSNCIEVRAIMNNAIVDVYDTLIRICAQVCICQGG